MLELNKKDLVVKKIWWGQGWTQMVAFSKRCHEGRVDQYGPISAQVHRFRSLVWWAQFSEDEQHSSVLQVLVQVVHSCSLREACSLPRVAPFSLSDPSDQSLFQGEPPLDELASTLYVAHWSLLSV